MHPPASDFSNSTVQGASNPVEAEAAQSNGNNRAQYEVSTVMNTLISVAMTENSRNNYSNRDTRTATAGVTDNPSTLVANTSENEKNNKGIMVFVYTTADKVLSFLCALTIFGLVYSHGPNPLLRISDAWIQVIAAGGVISTIGGIILTGAASYFKEIELPDHPGFVLISTMLFFILQYSVLASCIILQGFERSSKRIIWVIGAFVKLSIVAFWFAFQREPMIVGLKWTKDAFEWMLE